MFVQIQIFFLNLYEHLLKREWLRIMDRLRLIIQPTSTTEWPEVVGPAKILHIFQNAPVDLSVEQKLAAMEMASLVVDGKMPAESKYRDIHDILNHPFLKKQLSPKEVRQIDEYSTLNGCV